MGLTGAAQLSFVLYREYYVRGPVIPAVRQRARPRNDWKPDE